VPLEPGAPRRAGDAHGRRLPALPPSASGRGPRELRDLPPGRGESRGGAARPAARAAGRTPDGYPAHRVRPREAHLGALRALSHQPADASPGERRLRQLPRVASPARRQLRDVPRRGRRAPHAHRPGPRYVLVLPVSRRAGARRDRQSVSLPVLSPHPGRAYAGATVRAVSSRHGGGAPVSPASATTAPVTLVPGAAAASRS